MSSGNPSTGLQIVTKAMQKGGILTKNQVPDADEANDAIDAINDMLDSWALDSMMCYARTWELFTLQGGKGQYTIGPGQDFNTPEPIHLAGSFIRNVTYDEKCPIVDDNIYNEQITYKAAPGLPKMLNFDNGFPVGIIRLWPVPSAAYQLFLLSEKLLTELSLSATLSFPPGWERAIIFNGAIEICSDYDQEPPQVTVAVAKMSKAAIQKQIMKARAMDAYPQQAYTQNVYTGWNR